MPEHNVSEDETFEAFVESRLAELYPDLFPKRDPAPNKDSAERVHKEFPWLYGQKAAT